MANLTYLLLFACVANNCTLASDVGTPNSVNLKIHGLKYNDTDNSYAPLRHFAGYLPDFRLTVPGPGALGV